MTLKKAAECCGGKLVGCKDDTLGIRRAVIDSRAVEPGDLFVAYRGEKTDGHRFIQSALDKGAVCALVEYIPDGVEAAGYSTATKARLDGSKLAKLGWKPKYSIQSGVERTLRILKDGFLLNEPGQ